MHGATIEIVYMYCILPYRTLCYENWTHRNDRKHKAYYCTVKFYPKTFVQIW